MAAAKSGHVYDEKTRKQAVRILASGAGHRTLASKLGIPEATARQWARSYAVGGAAAVMNAGSTHRVYSYEVKLAAVQDRVENGMTVREVMIKYGVPSESSIKTWCRLYREQGPEALVNKPRGAKPKKLKEEAEKAGEAAGAGRGAAAAEAGEADGAAAEVAGGPRLESEPEAALGTDPARGSVASEPGV